MKRSYIPTCYFPSTVMFVDDSRDFLLNFTLQLDENFAYRLYDSAFAALQIVHKGQQEDDFNQRCLTEYVDANGCPQTNYTVNVDLAAIHGEVYNPKRFGEISVVVVDYAMPGMNGLEFCRRMENSPIKRILLTGRADERTAVEAFNDGIIDLYIQKQNPNITQLINESIAAMQFRYFQNMSDIVVKMLSVNSPNCLQDPAFYEAFNRIREENKIVEYYLSENSGSFLMLDADANRSYLVVKTEQDLKLHYEMALDNKAPRPVLDALSTGDKVPCFTPFSNEYPANDDDWENWMFPATKLIGKETYYFAFVKKPPRTLLNGEKILSFNTYLEGVDNKF